MGGFTLQGFDIPVVVSRIANIHYFEFTDKYSTANDSHSFCELVYVDKGRICVISDNYTGELSEGQCIIHTANETHSFHCVDKYPPNLIIIGFECVSPFLHCLSHAPTSLTDDRKRHLSEIVKEGMCVYAPPYDIPNTLNMVKRQEYPFGADQMIKLKLESFLILLIRDFQAIQTARQPEQRLSGDVLDVRQYIQEHYSEKITLSNLCFIFGTNKTTLCQKFKAQYGTTIIHYINQLRIREAKALLRKNDISVTRISDSLGFSSVHYFCRIFRQFVGLSPSEYASSIRAKLDSHTSS